MPIFDNYSNWCKYYTPEIKQKVKELKVKKYPNIDFNDKELNELIGGIRYNINVPPLKKEDMPAYLKSIVNKFKKGYEKDI